ncbi:unnamed protein product [Urochloa humidicola]
MLPDPPPRVPGLRRPSGRHALARPPGPHRSRRAREDLPLNASDLVGESTSQFPPINGANLVGDEGHHHDLLARSHGSLPLQLGGRGGEEGVMLTDRKVKGACCGRARAAANPHLCQRCGTLLLAGSRPSSPMHEVETSAIDGSGRVGDRRRWESGM